MTDKENERLKLRLKQLLALPQNKLCADCALMGPTWASKNLGVFVCMDCAGVHRSLGVHVSEVRSCVIDTWCQAWVTVMESVGNNAGNSIWEARLPPHKKLTPQATKEARAQFIRDKYERKAYYSPTNVAAAPTPVLSAAEQRKQMRLARLNNGAATTPSASPSKTAHTPSASPSPSPPPSGDMFSGMTVKAQAPQQANSLFQGMTMSSSPTVAQFSESPSLLDFDSIPKEVSYVDQQAQQSSSFSFLHDSGASPQPIFTNQQPRDPFDPFL